MKDTITPLNYTKEAIKDLSVMEKGLRSNAPLTSYIMRQVIDMLDSSVKFILPNCCDIIEPEEYRQTHFDLARLPYPVVTFEIPWFWICPYISRHLLSLNPLLACCRRYSRGER